MGVYNAELFNNLGLCCFYGQQYDMTLTCFERALSLADDDLVLADVWFNIGHVALVSLCVAFYLPVSLLIKQFFNCIYMCLIPIMYTYLSLL